MNIYTYYDKITNGPVSKFDNQDLMIEVWSKNWQEKGFNPIVLDSTHAEEHDYYEEFIAKCKSIHIKLMGYPLKPYGLTCFARWLAYASRSDSKMLVSDYDVMNNNYTDVTSIDRLEIMGTGPTPCFAYGSPFQFAKLARLFVDLTEKNMTNNTYIQNGPHWHDQNAIRGNIHDFSSDFIHFSDTIDSWFHENWRKKPLIHVSHYFTKTYKQHYKKSESLDRLRIQLMKEFLPRLNTSNDPYE